MPTYPLADAPEKTTIFQLYLVALDAMLWRTLLVVALEGVTVLSADVNDVHVASPNVHQNQFPWL